MWLRFVDGRPVSAVTSAFLAWCAQQAQAQGKRAVLLIWDNASWHDSRIVRTWLRTHNPQVTQTGQGVRLLACSLPITSPWLHPSEPTWLHPSEPTWLHSKKRVVEPTRLLAADDLAERVCATLGCPHHPHLVAPQTAAPTALVAKQAAPAKRPSNKAA